MYYLQHRAALKSQYRYFSDDWDINAHAFEIAYIHPLGEGLVLDARFRHYTQNKADFYSDLFPDESSGVQNFRARDKELSTFTSNTIGIGVEYDLFENGWKFIDRGSINFYWDHIFFDYEDFRDIRSTVNGTDASLAGTEPFYSFEADVFRIFFSIWY